MQNSELSLDIHGNKLYHEVARQTLPILVRQAKAGKTIYYADLAQEINLPNPRNLNYPLGSIGTTLIELSKIWGEEIPQIQCIVISKSSELPGEGIDGFITDKNKFKKLNKKQKKSLVDGILAKIFSYDKWDTVLEILNLPLATIDEDTQNKVENITSQNMGGGGEGEAHKQLKRYIQEHPECVGIKGMNSELEKTLPSGDSIDIFFENSQHWVVVEVKSKISKEFDIVRGLYQCVKYQAVMGSYLAVLNIQKDVRTVLALDCNFPDSLIPVKNIFGIEVIQNINV